MSELIRGLLILILYFIVFASLVILLRKCFKMPKEVNRKLLHFVLLFSLPVFLYAFEHWYISAIAAILFAVIVFPVLAMGERVKGYAELLVERSNGEIKRSLLLVFTMFALLIAVLWGWLGDKYLVLICIFAWGFGDATAALVGTDYGKTHLEGQLIEGRKSLEGTLSMFLVSFITIFLLLMLRGGMLMHLNILTAFITAAVVALVELFTLNGFDTVTCPLAAAAVLVPLLYAFGGL